MRYHFKDEPVQVYLNDESVIQLYKAYNVVLVAKVLKANGNHPPVPGPAAMTLDMANLQHIKKIAAAIKTPYLHTLEEVVASSLPCISDSGSTEEHVVFTIGVELLLNTEYTVEITKQGEVVNPAANQYRTPLYKFAFRTSRYASAEVFAQSILASKMRTILMTAAFPIMPKDEVTDNEMQELLLNAGVSVPAIPGDIQVSMLWTTTPQGDGSVSTPEAILVDTPEPLWRRRFFPDEEIVQSESGPMTHWVMAEKYEIEIQEAIGNAVVQKLIRTQGGARTLIILQPASAGKLLHLQMKRHHFSPRKEDYNTPANMIIIDMLQTTIPSVAPWEEEE
ncbi:MAG: hypothetical protein EOP49_20270 [Sphingobacteriales bacterium]|nr:MAG: hypothetical protein EOP49_20270 [Sphingobacteriales bacterium]